MKKTGVVAKTIKKREKSRPGRQKCKKKTGFFAHFTTLFLAPQCLKSTFFFIRVKKGHPVFIGDYS